MMDGTLRLSLFTQVVNRLGLLIHRITPCSLLTVSVMFRSIVLVVYFKGLSIYGVYHKTRSLHLVVGDFIHCVLTSGLRASFQTVSEW